MISGIGPERAPNGDFGGRSFQGVGGVPTSLRSAPVPFPGAPNNPGSDIADPNIMRDTAGRRSNATIQYSRVVPMGSKLQKLETEALRPGVLAWTSKDDHMQRRAGRGVERMYKLTSWDWLQQEVKLYDPPNTPPQGQPPRAADDDKLRQRHAVRDGGTSEVALELTKTAAAFFGLDNPEEMKKSPYLMWRGWSDSIPFRDPFEIDNPYDMLFKVRALWQIIYETTDDGDNEEAEFQQDLQRNGYLPDSTIPPRLLSREVMGEYTPDGFVLYKYSTEGADSVAEGQLDDAQNGLFNIVVGGHALVTSWAVFDPVERPYGPVQAPKKAKRLVTLPRDTLFIVVKGRWLPRDASGEGSEGGRDEGGGWFVDLRYVRSTSEELMHNSSSQRRLGQETNVDLKKNEVVLGAWRIGSVVDSAASRTRPSSFASAPVTPPQTMGLTVSVGIRWITSYELHDMFHEQEVVDEPGPEELKKIREAVRKEASTRTGEFLDRPVVESVDSGAAASGATSSVTVPGDTTGFRGTFRFGQ